jgi:hypothetical protein
MIFTPSFVLNITKAAGRVELESGETLIILRRHYAHLEKELANAFARQKEVRILVDRREGERRKQKSSISPERRRSDRRKQQEELLKVILPT